LKYAGYDLKKKKKWKDHNRLHNIGRNYLGTVLEKIIEEQEYRVLHNLNMMD